MDDEIHQLQGESDHLAMEVRQLYDDLYDLLEIRDRDRSSPATSSLQESQEAVYQFQHSSLIDGGQDEDFIPTQWGQVLDSEIRPETRSEVMYDRGPLVEPDLKSCMIGDPLLCIHVALS